MPTYVYECRGCKHGFEEVQGIKAAALVTCPKCSRSALARVIQPATFVFLDNEHGTVGAIAERNTQRVVRELGYNPTDPKPRPKPWWRSSARPRKDILRNPRKYVETGEV